LQEEKKKKNPGDGATKKCNLGKTVSKIVACGEELETIAGVWKDPSQLQVRRRSHRVGGGRGNSSVVRGSRERNGRRVRVREKKEHKEEETKNELVMRRRVFKRRINEGESYEN